MPTPKYRAQHRASRQLTLGSGFTAATMTELPSGEVTFLFTDVEGSTRLWEERADVMRGALAEHDRRMREAVERHGGYVFTTAGDSFAVAFGSATNAMVAALEAQQSFVEPCETIDMRVRMALHTGTATLREGDYFGPVVNRSARLMSAGHGGQILTSAATAELVRGELAEGVELIDLGERRLKDLLLPERIYQLQHPDLDSKFADLKTLDGPWSNLPVQLTSLVGRDQEMAEVQKMLTVNRFVTLTGSGGSGKTRLALQSAVESQDLFPDGIRLVELAPLTDPDLAIDEVAQVFGAQVTQDISAVEAMAAKVGSLKMLLVLDNCEHLLEPMAALTGQLLATCPSLKILATSRERLGVSGEIPYRVPSLQIPELTDPGEAIRYGSVQLFTERAVVAKPGFAVTSDNVEDVVAICRHLDGMPLALELAAARLRMMTASEVAKHLDERFRLLGGAKGSGSERHRTLQATIDWSHDLLTHDEQVLFRRLSVFAGNFTLEGVESVGSEEPLDAFVVLDLISTLVDKSMIVPDDGSGGETRYRLLESMRQYGSVKLEESLEGPSVASKHSDFYTALSEALLVKYRSGELAEALVLLDQDEDNIRAVLRRTLDDQEPEFAARIVGSIGYLWYVAGAFREGVDWSQQLFALDLDLPDDVMAQALHSYALFLGSWEPTLGVRALEREVEIRTRLGDPARLAAALNNLGNVYNDVGRTDEAEVALRKAIKQLREIGESVSSPLAALGYARLHASDYEGGKRLYSESLEEAKKTDDKYEIAVAITHIGQCAVHLAQLEEARSLLEEGRAGFAALGSTPGVAIADFNLALVDRAEKKPGEAAARLLASLESPDSHWYVAEKFWLVQTAASIITDRVLAAELLGVAAAFYDKTHEVQPAYIIADLEETRQQLSAELGDDAFLTAEAVGRRLPTADAIAATRTALAELANATEPSTSKTPDS